MKKRNVRKKINLLKCIASNGKTDVKQLLRYFQGSWSRLARYLASLEDQGYYYSKEDHSLFLTEKGEQFLIKTK
jgi:predicted transcriptional regulator